MSTPRVADSVLKALYGRPVRVRLAGWVLARHGEAFYQQLAQDALRKTSDAPSAVRKELELFVSHNLLTSFPDGRRLYYVQVPSPHWEALQAVAEACGVGEAFWATQSVDSHS